MRVYCVSVCVLCCVAASRRSAMASIEISMRNFAYLIFRTFPYLSSFIPLSKGDADDNVDAVCVCVCVWVAFRDSLRDVMRKVA